MVSHAYQQSFVFQSTRPVWGATTGAAELHDGQRISIHAPRVGRDAELISMPFKFSISIHAPRVGRDCVCAYFTITT